MRLTYILKWIETPLEESTSTWKTDHNTLKVDPEKGALKVQNYGLHWTLEKFSIIREVD